jgi:hypothetical protein
MTPQEQARTNTLLAEPDHIDLSKLLADGRIGLYVGSALARRHGIAVRLQSNIYGGIQAVLVVPRGLMGDEPAEAPHQSAHATPRPVQAAAPRHPTVPAPPAAQPMAPPQRARSPRQVPPVAQPVAQPTAQAQHYAGPVEPPVSHDRGPSHESAIPDGRPRLPQRRAQENLVPELRNGPITRRDVQEVEHDPGLMATFQRGVSLADDDHDERPADSSR